MSRARDKKMAGYLEGSISIAVNSALFALKYYYGVAFNSIAIVADSFHTLSDSLTSVVLILSFLIAYRPADAKHPFGYGRVESVATIVIGSILVAVGVEIAHESYEKLISRESLVFDWILISILASSALVKEMLALWAFRLGRKYGSVSIRADAWHHRSDALVTALLTVAILLGSNLWWLDSALGFALSSLIVYVGVSIVHEKAIELLGRAPTSEELRRVKEVVHKISPLVQDVHQVRMHSYGEHVEITLHVRLPPKITVLEAHDIATKIENKIKEELEWNATVHVEPYVVEDRHCASEGGATS